MGHMENQNMREESVSYLELSGRFIYRLSVRPRACVLQ